MYYCSIQCLARTNNKNNDLKKPSDKICYSCYCGPHHHFLFLCKVTKHNPNQKLCNLKIECDINVIILLHYNSTVIPNSITIL